MLNDVHEIEILFWRTLSSRSQRAGFTTYLYGYQKYTGSLLVTKIASANIQNGHRPKARISWLTERQVDSDLVSSSPLENSGRERWVNLYYYGNEIRQQGGNTTGTTNSVDLQGDKMTLRSCQPSDGTSFLSLVVQSALKSRRQPQNISRFIDINDNLESCQHPPRCLLRNLVAVSA